MKSRILNFINKYKIQLGILLFFLIWMLFADEYNWIRIRKDHQKLNKLKDNREYLQQKIKEDRQQLKILQNDTQQLEKFAREEYLLKKDDEDVFIIIEEE